MAKTLPGKHDLSSYSIKGANKVVRVGDCVLMKHLDIGKPPYVAQVKKIEADNQNNVKVRLRWYCRPEESMQGRRQFHGAKELFLSDRYGVHNEHIIIGKCTVHSLMNYTKLENVGPDDYFCRFEYKSATGAFTPNYVAVYCKCEMPYNPDDLMDQCEGCKDWFHPSCIGLSIEEAKKLNHFLCSICAAEEDPKKASTTLSSLVANDKEMLNQKVQNMEEVQKSKIRDQMAPVSVLKSESFSSELPPIENRLKEILVMDKHEGSLTPDAHSALHSSLVADKRNSSVSLGGQMNSGVIANVKLSMTDISPGIAFWKNSIICKVLGANPHLRVFEGFVHRVWGVYGVSDVALVRNGIFAVRFKENDKMLEAMNSGMLFFDDKPVISRVWHSDMKKQDMEALSVPVWVRLMDLELKYWDEDCIMKLASALGKPIQVDNITKRRRILKFARVLVDMAIEDVKPDCIIFENEHGEVVKMAIELEWPPARCSKCEVLAHGTTECRKKVGMLKQPYGATET